MSKTELHRKADLCEQAADRTTGYVSDQWQSKANKLHRMAALIGTVYKEADHV